jgi:hypothetical protein
MITEKKCSTCGGVRPVSEFYRNSQAKDGCQRRCKDCFKKYRQSERGKTLNKEAARIYRQTEKGKAVDKKYRQSEKGKAVSKKYNQSEKGHSSAAWARFRLRDHAQAYRRRRYQLKKLGPNFKPAYDQPINYTATSFVGDL